jgi:hypothetical protein
MTAKGEGSDPWRGLGSTLLFTTIVKVAVFLVGVAIMGFFVTRTSAVAGGNAPMFALNQWAHIEAYTDYRDLYLRDLVAPFLTGDKNIYYLGTIVYNYPPLFIYVLGGFAYLVNIAWFPAVSLLLFDILTVIPFYMIAREFVFAGNAKLAFAASIIWALNPLNLFYNDLMWLNPPYTTFFLMLALYLLLKKRWVFSSIALAVSTGFKQITVIFFPVVLLFIWKATGFSKKLLSYVAVYISVLVLISTPYIEPVYQGGSSLSNPLGSWSLRSAQNYFWSLNFPILGNPPGIVNTPTPFSADLSEPVRLTFFLGEFPGKFMQNLAVATYSYLDYALVAAYAILLIHLFLKVKKGEPIKWSDLFVYAMGAFLLFLIFFGRGIYKYYFATLTPLALPIYSNRKGALLFEIFCIAVIVVPRAASPWMAVLLLTLVPTFLLWNKEAAEFVWNKEANEKISS